MSDFRKIKDFSLYWPGESSFPFILRDESWEVAEEIYYDVGDETIDKIDGIEGVDSALFQRELVKVETRKGNFEAVAYIAGARLRTRYEGSTGHRSLVPGKENIDG